MARGPWLHLVNHRLDHDFLSQWQACCLSIGDTMRITVTANCYFFSFLLSGLAFQVIETRLDYHHHRVDIESGGCNTASPSCP